MAKQNKSRKFFATATTAALVASAIVPVASAASFTDADKIGSWAQEAVDFLADKEIITGNPDGSFNPQGKITRAESAKMFTKALDLSTEGTEDFSDVTEGQWFYEFVVAVSNAGIVNGKGDGLFAPKANLTRAEAAKMIVEAYELTGEADLSNFSDANTVAGKWSEAYLSTAVANGVINGKDGKLAANDSITRQEFAVMFKRAIDAAEVDPAAELAEALTALETATNALPKEVTIDTVKEAKEAVAAVKAASTEAQAALEAAEKAEAVTEEEVTKAKAAIEAAQTAVTATEKAIEAAEEAAKEFAVSSVTAINATQVKVVFSKKVDETTAKTAANYTFTSLDGVTASTSQTAELLADKKTVIVTVDKPLSKRYQVKISNVKAADANTTVSYDEVLTFAADTTAPTITGTERISANKVKIKFSEPVTGTSSNITAKYADGTAISNLGSLAITAKDELIVDMSDAAVIVGKDIVITFNGVTDTNGNLLDPQPATVTVKKEAVDGVAPAISSISQSGAKEFTLKFNKDLVGFEFTADKAEVEVSGAEVTGITKVTASEYKVTVKTNLDGIQTVTVKAKKAVDLAGQSNAEDLKKLVTFTADTTAPKATSKLVVGKDNKEYVELTFDKDVVAGDVTINGSYVKDYVTTTLSSPVTATAKYADGTGTDKKVVLVPLTDASLSVEGAVYNLKITSTAVESLSGVDMSETVATFTRGKDGQSTTTNSDVVTSVAVAKGSTPDKVTVRFTIPSGQKLDGATATNIANYSIAGAVVESVTLEAASGTTQVATLTLKEDSNTFTGVRNITVKNVKISGSTKVMEPVTINNVELDENVRPTLVGAAITANNKITLTFSEAMTVEKTGAFLVKAGTSTVATTAGAAVESDSTKVTITLDSALTSTELAQIITVEPAQLNGEVDTTNFKVKDSKGNYLKAFAPVTVVKP